MPPSGLFISEFMIFRSLFEANYLVVLIVVMILLTMIIWAFGKNVFKLLFSPAVDFKEEGLRKIKPAESIVTIYFTWIGCLPRIKSTTGICNTDPGSNKKFTALI